jgi:hypothetical protein
MLRFLSSPAVMIVTLTLFAQTSAPSSDTTEHAAASCVVAGRVVTAAEGNPRADSFCCFSSCWDL